MAAQENVATNRAVIVRVSSVPQIGGRLVQGSLDVCAFVSDGAKVQPDRALDQRETVC